MLITSATGYNALDDPANDTIVGTAETPGEWSTVKSTFRHAGLFENVQSVLSNGNALLASTQDFLAYRFYEFDTSLDQLNDVSILELELTTPLADIVTVSCPLGTPGGMTNWMIPSVGNSLSSRCSN